MRRILRLIWHNLQARRRAERRIAVAVERLVRLYEMDLDSRGLVLPDPKGRKSPVEILYSAEEPVEEEADV